MLKLRGLKRYLPSSPTPPTLYVLAFEAKDIVWTIYLLFFNNSFCELHGAHFGRVHHQFFSKVPVRRFPQPSRSKHFGDVSETNWREKASLLRSDHMTRNALAA